MLPKKYYIFRLAFKKANYIFAASKYTSNKIRSIGIKCNLKNINPGVNKSLFKSDKSIRKENNIVFVGNGKPRKGLNYLLKACLLVPSNLINKIYLVGNFRNIDNEIDLKLKALKKKKINISFLSNMPSKRLVEIYQNSKVNVLPSQEIEDNFEGFGLVHLEANACGTLSIGCLNSGNTDAIKKGFGYLVPQADYKILSKKIITILQKKEYPSFSNKKIRSWKEFANDYEKNWLRLLR